MWNVQCTMWNVEYGPTGFAQGMGTTVSATSTTLMLAGLTPATGYDIYVQSNCATDGTSAFVGPVSFETQCATLTPPYLEDFASFVPVGWEEASDGDPTTGPMTLGQGDWGSDGFANNGFSGAARVNLFNVGTQDWLISPSFDLSVPGPWELVFDVALTTFSGTTATTMGSDDEVQLILEI